MIRNFGAIQGLKGQPQGLLLGQGTGGNALVGDVISGKTFTNDLGQLTGIATIASLGGKRFATGTSTTDGSSNITVTGLAFKPSIVITTRYGTGHDNYFMAGIINCAILVGGSGIDTFNFGSGNFYASSNNSLNSNGFVVTTSVANDSTQWKWIAIE